MQAPLFLSILLASAAAQTPSAPPAGASARPDPVLAIAAADSGDQTFRMIVAKAVATHPTVREAGGASIEAKAARAEARSGLFPTIDLTAQSYRVLARNFNAQDLSVLYENSRAQPRTDVLASVSQTLFDFGATFDRISAATARLRAASAGVEDAADRVALAMISAWYDVFTYRALAAMADRHAGIETALRDDVGARIERGFSAEADLLRVDSAVAATRARAAGYRRLLGNAEARYRELSGEDAPATLERAPPAAPGLASAEAARLAADRRPAVVAAGLQAAAARKDAAAARADRLPNLSAGVEAGRYGILEHKPDYDVRGQVTLRQRFSGAVFARAHEVEARALQADARSDRARQEAERDAVIAWGDVRSIDEQVKALAASYVAGRDSRTMLAERFRVSRGTLFDVLSADDAEFAAAAAYIEGIGDRDAARYVLLSRTGKLLDALGIDPALVNGQANGERREP